MAIPTRGRAVWCAEAVASALAQEGVDLEVVVALDGEDAETRARLDALGDPRVRLVVQATAGRSAARNLAWRSTRAARIAFLDDDDRLLPGSLTRLEALARHPGAVLCHGRALPMDADRSAAGRRGPRPPRGAGAAPYDALIAQCKGRSVLPSTVLVGRAALERSGGFPEDLPTGEDWLTFLRLSAAGPFVALDAPVVLYRKHEGQVRWDPAQQEAALPDAALALVRRSRDPGARPALPPEAGGEAHGVRRTQLPPPRAPRRRATLPAHRGREGPAPAAPSPPPAELAGRPVPPRLSYRARRQQTASPSMRSSGSALPCAARYSSTAWRQPSITW